MKNIEVIDEGSNCVYDIFSATEEEFALIFPNGQDIEFSDDFFERVGESVSNKVLGALWSRPQDRKTVTGIHGILFYGFKDRKQFFPTKVLDQGLTLPRPDICRNNDSQK